MGSPYFWLHFVKDHYGHLAKISVMLLPDLGVFQNRLINLRKTLPALQNGGMEVINTGNPHLFGYIRAFNHQRLLIVNNFSEQQQLMDVEHLRNCGVTKDVVNLLKDEILSFGNDMLLHDHQAVWLDISGS